MCVCVYNGRSCRVRIAYNDRRQLETTKQLCRIEPAREEKAVGSLRGNGKGRFPSDVKTAGIELRNRDAEKRVRAVSVVRNQNRRHFFYE